MARVTLEIVIEFVCAAIEILYMLIHCVHLVIYICSWEFLFVFLMFNVILQQPC